MFENVQFLKHSVTFNLILDFLKYEVINIKISLKWFGEFFNIVPIIYFFSNNKIIIMSSYNALYPPNVGAQSAVHIHITDKEYNTQYMLIADTFTVHRETGKQNSKSAPVPQCGDTPFPSMWDLYPTSVIVSLFETFMAISTMNIKSGTNGHNS